VEVKLPFARFIVDKSISQDLRASDIVPLRALSVFLRQTSL
jgi:hypothetical protein